MKDFWEILFKLVTGYWHFGKPFLAAHASVITFILYDSWYRKIRRETNSLKLWNPPTDQPTSISRDSETTHLLDQFTTESQKLGGQGFFIPMTDFSDRLDSIVDGMIAELHDRTNLLLIVGISGTLFGVFEFAFRAQEAISDKSIPASEQMALLGKYLSGSMAKAFPVGFMGLMLTLIFQVWAAFPERRLLNALSTATRKALQQRERMSRSQADIVRQSTERLETAMQPLADLKDTLTLSVQPVIAEFGERLDQSLNLVKVQTEKLQESTESVHEAVQSVHEGVSSLEAVAESLKVLLHKAPDVLERIIRIQGHQEASLIEFDECLSEQLRQTQKIGVDIDGTIKAIKLLPQDVLREHKAVLHYLGEDSLALWANISHEFGQKLYSDYLERFDDIDTRAKETNTAVETILQQLQQVVGGISAATESLREVPSTILNGTKEVFGDVSKQSLEVWKKMSEEYGSSVHDESIKYLTTVELEVEKIRTSLVDAAEELKRVGQSSDELLVAPIEKALNNIRSQISGDLQELNRVLAERYPEISKDVLVFSNDLKTSLGQVQEIQNTLASWLQDARSAQAHVHEVHQDMLIPDLLKSTIDELKLTNERLNRIQQDKPASDNGIYDQLQRALNLLSSIRATLEQMAHKERIIDRIRRWRS